MSIWNCRLAGRDASRRPSIESATMSTLLDTNVVSELIRRSPDLAVRFWAASQALEDLFFSAVGEAELRYGAAILAAGRRKDTLIGDIERMLRAAFDNRILPFNSAAARAYADVAATRRSLGRPVPATDCQIAAIARANSMAIATRNVRDFEDMGIEVIDPWTAG